MIKAIPWVLLSSLWGTLVFVLGLHLMFPSDLAKDRLRYEVETASGGSWLVDAESADLWWGTGVSLDKAVLYKVEKSRHGRRGAAQQATPPLPFLQVDRAAVRLKLLPLLTGRTAISYAIDLYGGGIYGSAGMQGEALSLEIQGEDLDMGRMPIEGSDWSIDATGMGQMDVELVLDPEEIKASTGHLLIDIQDFAITDGMFGGSALSELSQLADSLPLTFTRAHIEGDVEDGKIKLKDSEIISELVEIALEGDIGLHKSVERWRLRLEAKVKLADDLDKFAKMAPMMKSARDDEGTYHFLISGTLLDPSFKEDRTSARGKQSDGARSRPGRRTTANRDDSEEEGAAPEDQRRKDRMDRVRDRRERDAGRPDVGPEEAGSFPRRPPRRRTDEDASSKDDMDIGPSSRYDDFDDDLEDYGDLEKEDFDEDLQPPMPPILDDPELDYP